MYPLVEPRQRPERFTLNRFSPLAESAAFLGLGGFDAAGSAWYPDAMRLLGAVPNDGTLINMNPATDWVWSPELGRWATSLNSAASQYILSSQARLLPLTLSAWFRPFSTTEAAAFLSVCTSSGSGRVQLGWVPSDPPSALQVVTVPTSGTARSSYISATPASVVNTWVHMVGVFSSGAFRQMYTNNVPATANTEPAYPGSGMDRVIVGARYASGTLGGYFLGEVADACVFSGTLPPGYISALADPSNVMLEVGGVPLILPPRRVASPAAVAEEPSGFKPYWARPSYQIIGGGIA